MQNKDFELGRLTIYVLSFWRVQTANCFVGLSWKTEMLVSYYTVGSFSTEPWSYEGRVNYKPQTANLQKTPARNVLKPQQNSMGYTTLNPQFLVVSPDFFSNCKPSRICVIFCGFGEA